jgi:hypothetical protein
MRIFVLDTEYLSWNKEESNKSLKKRPQNHPAEIIQLYLREIYTKKKNKNEINLFVKPQHFKKYPHRISKVTSITKKFLDKYGKDFRQSYKKLTDFIPSKSLIISNGDECGLIDYNISL